MCLNPISIVNPTKYVSLKYRDRYLLQVPCGKCAECQSTLSNQWLYRSFVEFKDCLSNHSNFIMFDCLTYSPEHLPHYSNYVDFVEDYPCFNREHIKLFFKRLRIKCIRLGYKNVGFRYFLSSEYGSLEGRPHYHLLLFVYNNGDKLTPLLLSQLISDSWTYGRTDGIPYKSSYYVLSHNVISTNNVASMLRTANYVTKYVQKNCIFQRILDSRIHDTLLYLGIKFGVNDFDVWYKSLACRRIKRKLLSITNQFHMQSLHYGESALSEIDLNEIFENPVLLMPHFKGVKVAVLLPTYYKRKLFYNLVEVDGTKCWQLNDIGIQYCEYRKQRLLRDLESRFQCVCIQYHLPFDCHKLADYVLNSRGRIRATLPESTIEQRLDNLDLFNYVTFTDKDNLGEIGLSPKFIGNCSIGYKMEYLPKKISIKEFIGKHVIIDDALEKQLSEIYYKVSYIDRGKQDAYELKQRLTNLYRCFI